MDRPINIPVLSPEEIRVLGSLIEKSKTTPDYYPMTINAITQACNQKTSRNPVVEYSEETVSTAISNLKAISLVATAIGGGSRTIKYEHNFTTLYPVTDAELAILCLLFLRGPQTPGELNTNAARLYNFTSLEHVSEVLNKLMHHYEPFVKEMPKRPGQKETRYIHLLGDDKVITEAATAAPNPDERIAALEQRVSQLEDEVRRLKGGDSA